MPMYEYRCRDCGHAFEELRKLDDAASPPCPKCTSAKTERRLSLSAPRSKNDWEAGAVTPASMRGGGMDGLGGGCGGGGFS